MESKLWVCAIRQTILSFSSLLSLALHQSPTQPPPTSSWFALHPVSNGEKSLPGVSQRQAVGRRVEREVRKQTNRNIHMHQKIPHLSRLFDSGIQNLPDRKKKCFHAYLNSAVLGSVCQLCEVPRVLLTKGKGNFSPCLPPILNEGNINIKYCNTRQQVIACRL